MVLKDPRYLTEYFEIIPEERVPEFASKFSKNINLSTIFENMSITPKPENTLRECSAPSGEYLRNPIINPDSADAFYEIDKSYQRSNA